MGHNSPAHHRSDIQIDPAAYMRSRMVRSSAGNLSVDNIRLPPEQQSQRTKAQKAQRQKPSSCRSTPRKARFRTAPKLTAHRLGLPPDTTIGFRTVNLHYVRVTAGPAAGAFKGLRPTRILVSN